MTVTEHIREHAMGQCGYSETPKEDYSLWLGRNWKRLLVSFDRWCELIGRLASEGIWVNRGGAIGRVTQ